MKEDTTAPRRCLRGGKNVDDRLFYRGEGFFS